MTHRANNQQHFFGLTRGFSLLEMMVALVILLAVTGIVMSSMMQASLTQGTISNRTEMHSGIRSASELLQQEIGQAGRIFLSGGPTQMQTAVALGADPNVPVTATVTLDSVTGLYPGMFLVIDTGDAEETIAITSITSASNQITATFSLAHAVNVPVRIDGVFSSGIVPTNYVSGGTNYGSDGFHLKMYGDVNDDGNMVYVEYICDTTGGNLYRSVTSIGSAAPGTKQVLLPNLIANPGGTACFQYQELSKGGNTYDVDVSVTLSIQTAALDPQTHQQQKETKALLNVSPRNLYDGYQMAAAGITNRIQPMPPTVANLVTQAP